MGIVLIVGFSIAIFIGVTAIVIALAEICAEEPRWPRGKDLEATGKWRNYTTRRPH
ncbi:MAG TPA: hypothetical protein VGO52_08360 [Hyphomonadaceae bacterium]|jgi:hypothetical protein|nr:hypothetical protein [Hyphomonadaceae bacterium]